MAISSAPRGIPRRVQTFLSVGLIGGLGTSLSGGGRFLGADVSQTKGCFGLFGSAQTKGCFGLFGSVGIAVQSVRRVRRVVEITEHRCQWCGEWFETRRSDARYCPQPRICRLQAHRAERGK